MNQVSVAIAVIAVVVALASAVAVLTTVARQHAKIVGLERRLGRINVFLDPDVVVASLNRGTLRLPEPTIIQPGTLPPQPFIARQYMVHSELDPVQGRPNETWVWS